MYIFNKATQETYKCSKSTIEIQENGVKHAQGYQNDVVSLNR